MQKNYEFGSGEIWLLYYWKNPNCQNIILLSLIPFVGQAWYQWKRILWSRQINLSLILFGRERIKLSALFSSGKSKMEDWKPHNYSCRVYYWNAESTLLQEIGKRSVKQLENNSSALPKICWQEFKLVFCCNFQLQKLPIKLPKFYEECLKSFAKCSTENRGSIQDLNGNDLAKIILWNNKFICIGGKSVHFKKLAEKKKI